MTSWTPTRRDLVAGAAAFAAAPAATLVAAVTSVVHEVDIKSFEFAPAVLRVRVGDRIRWTNQDLAPHTATADAFGWGTGALARGETGEILVERGMETSYFCVFHPHMKAQIDIAD